MNKILLLTISISLLLFSNYSRPANASLSNADVIIELNEVKDLNSNSKVIINGIIVGKVGFVANEGNKNVVGLNLDEKYLNSLNYSTIAILKSPMTVEPEYRHTSIELITPDQVSKEIPSKIKGFSTFQEFWTADLGSKSSIYEVKTKS